MVAPLSIGPLNGGEPAKGRPETPPIPEVLFNYRGYHMNWSPLGPTPGWEVYDGLPANDDTFVGWQAGTLRQIKTQIDEWKVAP